MFVQIMTLGQYWPHPGANQFFIGRSLHISLGFCAQVSAFEPLGFHLLKQSVKLDK